MLSARRWTFEPVVEWDDSSKPDFYRPAWMKSGNCVGVDPDLFFPEAGAPDAVDAAKAVCDGCPVIQECRDWADECGEKFGIWGGESSRERRRRRSERGRKPRAQA